jgi:hypothetical protein
VVKDLPRIGAPSDIRVQFVRQPTPNTCVHACLAMVTGVPVAELIARFGDQGLYRLEEATVLTEYGILPEPASPEDGWRFPAVYLASVPSLNRPGYLHRIVVFAHVGQRAKEWRVYDPNMGISGTHYHKVRAFYRRRKEPPVVYCELTRLAVLWMHRGTAERLRLYAVREGARSRKVPHA